MPDATPTSPEAHSTTPQTGVADALRAEVDALVGAPADAGAAAVAQVDDAAELARQIEQILGEEAMRARSEAAEASEGASASVEGLSGANRANLEAEIDALLADASMPGGTTGADVKPEASAPAPQGAASTPLASPLPPAAEPAGAAAPAPVAGVEPVASAGPAPGVPSASVTTSEPGAQGVVATAPASPAAPAVQAVPASPARVVVEEVKPAGAVPGVVAMLGRPLAGKPAIVRGAVALVGVNTLVLAVFVWAFVLFLRPTPQEVRAGAFDFQGGAVPRVPDAPAGASTPLDGHGKDAHAKDTHAEPKKPAKSGGKGEKQGGGGH